MAIDFDVTEYVSAPRLDAAGGIALAIALINAAPRERSAAETKALKALRAACAGLQDAWRAQGGLEKPIDPRPADRALDNAWSALLMVLEAQSMLPEDHYPASARAAALIDRLFPERLSFTQMPYAAEWAESDKRMQRIETEGLGADLDRLCGKDFLAELRRSHAEYGKVLGITRARAAAKAAAGIAGPLRNVQRALQAYAMQVAASVDADEPLTVERAKTALAPIDRARAAAARPSRGGGAPAPGPGPAPIPGGAATDAPPDPNGPIPTI
jgi:hypothetical protein